MRKGQTRNARAKGARIGRPQTTLDDVPANFLRYDPVHKSASFDPTVYADALGGPLRLCGIGEQRRISISGCWRGK